jgi:hypothetical protein
VRKPFSDRGLWLLRPDGYTAFVAKRDDVEAIAGYLRALTAVAKSSPPPM